uniref:Uncharacterized protein n=1 Tax=Listeria ivanovii TaxID=1638 RepID=A0A7T0MB48_LISIV|nr:hypothetical protein [Listeria ivanovii]QPL19490.1 hypothetical protein pLIS600276c [Listeria ivanovii]UCK61621.1 hypothetical protein pLIS46_00256c [Listeria ivanovii]
MFYDREIKRDWIDNSECFSFFSTPISKVYELNLNELFGELIKDYVFYHHFLGERQEREWNQLNRGWRKWVFRSKKKALQESIKNHTKASSLIEILKERPIQPIYFRYPREEAQEEELDFIMRGLDQSLITRIYEIKRAKSLDDFTNQLYDLTKVLNDFCSCQSDGEEIPAVLLLTENLKEMSKKYQEKSR